MNPLEKAPSSRGGARASGMNIYYKAMLRSRGGTFLNVDQDDAVEGPAGRTFARKGFADTVPARTTWNSDFWRAGKVSSTRPPV